MRLSKLEIENFRGIESAEIEFNRDITVLIGENNIGKTSVLEALRLCLDVVKSNKVCNFTEFDFYRDDKCKTLASCKPIKLTLTYNESKEHPWPDHITQSLYEVIVDSEYAVIKLRVEAYYDVDASELIKKWFFLDANGNELVVKDALIKSLRNLRPFFFQSALRAAKNEFHGQSTYWSSFLNNKDIDKEIRNKLENELLGISRKIVDAHGSFKEVTKELERISELVVAGKVDAVTVDPASVDIYETLRSNTDINLLTASNARIPVRCHGEGTQSLSVLLLFSAYFKNRLKTDLKNKYAEPIIAIEEPEAHLHPSAVRAVWQLLKNMPGQKIVATHSGDILSEVPIEFLRRMSRQKGKIKCGVIPNNLLDDEEMRKFNHHVRRNRGELFFARLWLLVEGETDASVLAECADILNIDIRRLGIRIIECSQAGGPRIFIKVAKELGIGWYLVADGDTGGEKYVKAAKKLLGTETEDDHISKLTKPHMDFLLCCSGYGDPYICHRKEQTSQDCTKSSDEVLSEKKSAFANKPQSEIKSQAGKNGDWDDFFKNLPGRFSKPVAAMEAILLMREKGESGVPPELAYILRKIKDMSEVSS